MVYEQERILEGTEIARKMGMTNEMKKTKNKVNVKKKAKP